MSVLYYGYEEKSPEKTLYSVAGTGRDPPASAAHPSAANPPELSPPFPLSLPSPIFLSITFSHLPLL
jgi:hypothetical protein